MRSTESHLSFLAQSANWYRIVANTCTQNVFHSIGCRLSHFQTIVLLCPCISNIQIFTYKQTHNEKSASETQDTSHNQGFGFRMDKFSRGGPYSQLPRLPRNTEHIWNEIYNWILNSNSSKLDIEITWMNINHKRGISSVENLLRAC